jgi:hypothetical protein
VDNPDLREMIDLATAVHLVDLTTIVLVGVAVLCLLIGLGRQRAGSAWLRAAAALAPAGLLIACGWDLYLWRVRFDPQTGFCGLHKVSVLLGNVVGAIVVGLLYGLYLRWLWGLPFGAPRPAQSQSEED